MNVGDLIDARYRVERLLGEGGMAAVYLARDERLERPVALKLLWGAPRVSQAMAESFLREARIAASIRHPNVVQVLDFGTHAGAPYMVMEALSGEAMADRYSRAYRFQTAEVVAVALGCLEGLAAVHATGIVHRDLKPENIFLTKPATQGMPEIAKLLDFGISRAADKSSGLRSAVTTREGRLVGTPEYMSPEQARGLSDIDLRTDLYSLGVVMYEALNGRPPFESKNDGDLMILVIAGNAPPLETRMPQVGPLLSHVIERAMSRDREARFQSAAAMHGALRAAWEGTCAAGPVPTLPGLAGQVISERPIEATLSELTPTLTPRGGATVVQQSGGDRRVLVAAVLVASVAVAGALAFVFLRPANGTQAAPRYIVVHGTGEKRDPPPQEAAPDARAQTPAPDDSVDMDFTIDDVEAELAAIKPGTRPPPRPHDKDPARLLARAFDKQKASVVRCLRDHVGELPAEAALSVRIELDAGGKVQNASVSPDTLAQAPVGQCVAGAAKAMEFGSQLGAVAFRVPLTAKRQ
jgi:hypothetical protein